MFTTSLWAFNLLTCGSVAVIYFLTGALIGFWIYRDAEARRDKNSEAWLFVGFFLNVVALLLYLNDKDEVVKGPPSAPPPPYQPQPYYQPQPQYPSHPQHQPQPYPQAGPYPQYPPGQGPVQGQARTPPTRYYQQQAAPPQTPPPQAPPPQVPPPQAPPPQAPPPPPPSAGQRPLEVREPEMPREYPSLDEEG